MENKYSLTTDRSDMFYWQSDRPFNGKETKEIFLDRHQKFNPEITKQAISYGMQQYRKSKTDSKVVRLDNPIASGSVNLVSKAILADETKIIIRAHPSNISNGYFWVEKIATEKAISLNVPVYKTYYIYDQKKEFDFDFMLIEQLNGFNVSKETSYNKKQLENFTHQTGRFAALINSVKTQGFGFFSNRIAKDNRELKGIHKQWKQHIYAAFEKNLQYLQDKKTISSTERKIIEKLFSRKENLIYCKSPRLIHNDIADWNQLADVNGKVTGMIDWDECFSGDYIMEFAQYSLFYDNPRLGWFKEGYETISKLGDDFEEKFHLYKLRYIVSKLHLRKVKLEDTYSDFLQDKLEFGLKCLNDELKWYGKNNK